jgi:hypothetical protein
MFFFGGDREEAVTHHVRLSTAPPTSTITIKIRWAIIIQP